jgi:hypothetical protein
MSAGSVKLLESVRLPAEELTRLREGLATAQRVPLGPRLALSVRDPKSNYQNRLAHLVLSPLMKFEELIGYLPGV